MADDKNEVDASDDKNEVDASNEGDSTEEIDENSSEAAVDNKEAITEGDDLDTIEMTLATDEFAEISTETEEAGSKPLNKSPLACSLCQDICKRGSKMKCCGKQACRGCAIKHVTSSRKCWRCGAAATTTDVINDDELRAKVDKKQQDEKEFTDGLATGELLKCCVCHEICKRGVTTPCCGVAACRACATKKITGARCCWLENCGQVGMKTEDLVNDMVLREAIDGFKKEGIVNEELAREIKDKRDEMNPVLVKAREEERRKKIEERKKNRLEKLEARKKERVMKRLEAKGGKIAPKMNGKGRVSKGKPAERVPPKGVIDLRSKLTTKTRSTPTRVKPIAKRTVTPLPLTRTIVNRKRSHTPRHSSLDYHKPTGFFAGTEFGQVPQPIMQMNRPVGMYSAEEQTKRELLATINQYKQALIEMGGLENNVPKKQKFMNDRQDYNWENSNFSRDTGRERMSRKESLPNEGGNYNWKNRDVPRDTRREKMPLNEPSVRKSRGKDWERDAERERVPRYESSSRKSRDRDWDSRKKNRDYEVPREIPREILLSEEDKEMERLRRDVERLRNELKDSQSSRRSYEREMEKRESPRKSHGRDTGRGGNVDTWSAHPRDDYKDNRRETRGDEYQQSYSRDNNTIWKDTGRDADPWRGATGMGGAMKERDTRDKHVNIGDRNKEVERYPLPWDNKPSKYSSTGGDSWMDNREVARNAKTSSRQEILSHTDKSFDPWAGNNSSAGPVGKDLDLRGASNPTSMNTYHRGSGMKSLLDLPAPVPPPYESMPSRSQQASMYQEMSKAIDDHMTRSSSGYETRSSRYGTSLAVDGYETGPKATSSYDSSKWGYDAPKSSSFFNELKSREPRMAILDQPRESRSTHLDPPRESRSALLDPPRESRSTLLDPSRQSRSALLDQPRYGGSSTREDYGQSSSYGMISYPQPKSQRRF